MVVEELDKVILQKGSWTTVLFKYRQLDRKTGEFGPAKAALRRYQKSGGYFRKRDAVNLSEKRRQAFGRQPQGLVRLISPDSWRGPDRKGLCPGAKDASPPAPRGHEANKTGGPHSGDPPVLRVLGCGSDAGPVLSWRRFQRRCAGYPAKVRNPIDSDRMSVLPGPPVHSFYPCGTTPPFLVALNLPAFAFGWVWEVPPAVRRRWRLKFSPPGPACSWLSILPGDSRFGSLLQRPSLVD